jgi:hypothetical protein
MKKSIWLIAAFVTGLLPGFFLVFNFMFSDVISLNERILSYLVVIAAYLLLGIAFGLAARDMGWKYGICLSLPAIILALIYSIKETGTAGINLLYATAALVPSITGSQLGAKFAGMRKQ